MKRHLTARYGPTFQVKQEKYWSMLLNFEENLGSMITEADDIEQILGIIMDKKNSLNAGLNFLEK